MHMLVFTVSTLLTTSAKSISPLNYVIELNQLVPSVYDAHFYDVISLSTTCGPFY